MNAVPMLPQGLISGEILVAFHAAEFLRIRIGHEVQFPAFGRRQQRIYVGFVLESGVSGVVLVVDLADAVFQLGVGPEIAPLDGREIAVIANERRGFAVNRAHVLPQVLPTGERLAALHAGVVREHGGHRVVVVVVVVVVDVVVRRG